MSKTRDDDGKRPLAPVADDDRLRPGGVRFLEWTQDFPEIPRDLPRERIPVRKWHGIGLVEGIPFGCGSL